MVKGVLGTPGSEPGLSTQSRSPRGQGSLHLCPLHALAFVLSLVVAFRICPCTGLQAPWGLGPALVSSVSTGLGRASCGKRLLIRERTQTRV